DWSSDVCSSDLEGTVAGRREPPRRALLPGLDPRPVERKRSAPAPAGAPATAPIARGAGPRRARGAALAPHRTAALRRAAVAAPGREDVAAPGREEVSGAAGEIRRHGEPTRAGPARSRRRRVSRASTLAR